MRVGRDIDTVVGDVDRELLFGDFGNGINFGKLDNDLNAGIFRTRRGKFFRPSPTWM